MATLTDLDHYFNNHPLRVTYSEFSAEEREAALNIALRDLRAAAAADDMDMEFFENSVAGENVSEILSGVSADTADKESYLSNIAGSMVISALFEHTFFLLLNPSYLSGDAESRTNSNLSPRADTLLKSANMSLDLIAAKEITLDHILGKKQLRIVH